MLLFTLLLQTATPDSFTTTRIILALLCVFVASALALGIAIGLNRRMQAIAGPPTAPDDPAVPKVDDPER